MLVGNSAKLSRRVREAGLEIDRVLESCKLLPSQQGIAWREVVRADTTGCKYPCIPFYYL